MNFKLFHEYERQNLLDFVGSKQVQSGIIWGDEEPGTVIITSGGKHGKDAGYGDIKNNDGTWVYVGQGSSGDQNPQSYANSLLTAKSRTILLFSTREPSTAEVKSRGNRNKQYRFEGLFDVLSWDLVLSKQGQRIGDKLLIFHLIPVDNIFDSFEINASQDLASGETINNLFDKIARIQTNPITNLSYIEYRYRSSLIKKYALLRAENNCELCLKPAPFHTSKGTPFLEVHHILKIADDGPDLPENVAALCPNCHREAHFGNRHIEIKHELISLIGSKEQYVRNNSPSSR